MLAGGMQLLLNEGRGYLVQRHQRRQGCQRQQHEEQQGDDIAHDGDGCKGLLEHVGQGDEDERGSRVWVHTYGEGGREYHESSQDGHHAVDDGNLRSRLRQIGGFREVAGIGTQTPHRNAQRVECLS